MNQLIEHLQIILSRAVESVGARAHGVVNHMSRLAGGAGLLLSLLLIAAAGLLGLAAALVIAMVPYVGVAGALAIVSAVLLSLSAVAAMGTWRSLSTPKLEPVVISPTTPLAPVDKDLRAIAGTTEPRPEPIIQEPSTFDKLPKVDPLFVAASVGAAAALLGPARLLRLLGTLTAGVGVARSLAPLADALHKYNDLQALDGIFGATTPRPPSNPFSQSARGTSSRASEFSSGPI